MLAGGRDSVTTAVDQTTSESKPVTGQLVDTGSDDSTKVQIKTRGGDRQVQLGNVDLMGSGRGLIGPNVDVSGSIYVDGMFDKLAIGDFTGGSFVIVNADGETTKFTARHVSDVDMLVSVGGRFRFDTWTNTDHTAYLLMVTGRHAALSITAEETMDAVAPPLGTRRSLTWNQIPYQLSVENPVPLGNWFCSTSTTRG